MFKTTIQQAIPVPKRDFYLFAGDSPIQTLKVGSYVTDGINKYEILTIPFMHRGTNNAPEPTDFILKPGDYDPTELVGKTLYEV